MGHPRKARKKYDTPPHPWNAERIKTENKLMSKYGLKNKKEIWKADTLVRKYSREARYLLGFSQDQGVLCTSRAHIKGEQYLFDIPISF